MTIWDFRMYFQIGDLIGQSLQSSISFINRQSTIDNNRQSSIFNHQF